MLLIWSRGIGNIPVTTMEERDRKQTCVTTMEQRGRKQTCCYDVVEGQETNMLLRWRRGRKPVKRWRRGIGNKHVTTKEQRDRKQLLQRRSRGIGNKQVAKMKERDRKQTCCYDGGEGQETNLRYYDGVEEQETNLLLRWRRGIGNKQVAKMEQWERNEAVARKEEKVRK